MPWSRACDILPAMPETARAAVLIEPRQPFELREYPIPDPAPSDLIVAISRAHICGTDVHLWAGDQDLRALGIPAGSGVILGHEMTGLVARLGSQVTSDALGRPLTEGDRVVFTYFHPCGRCRACASSRPHHCPAALSSTLRPVERPPHLFGAFASHVYVDARQRVFKVPEAVSDAAAASVNCALAQVLHGLDLAALAEGDAVVVQGLGGLGLHACALARSRGARLVVGVDAHPARLERARHFGAHALIDLATPPRERVRAVKALTEGWGADVVVEAAGHPDALPEGVRMLGRGGRLVELGCITPKRVAQLDPSTLTLYNRAILGSALYPPHTLARALDWLAGPGQAYPFETLTSHSWPLEAADAAFEAADPHADACSITRGALLP